MRRRRHRSRGQGLVEFALVLPILLLVVLVTIDFGRALYGWVVLQNSARIAANYAGVHPDGWQGGGNPVLVVEYERQIENDLNTANCDAPSVPPDPVFTDGPDTSVGDSVPDTSYDVGDTVRVTLTCDFRPLTPVIGDILGAVVPLGATSEFRIRSGDVAGLANPTQIPPPPTPTPSPSPSPSPGVSPSPVVSPSPSPACVVVPDLVGRTVAQARTLWTGLFTGSFTPANGSPNKTVLTQTTTPSANPGDCVAPTTSVVVTHT